MQQDERQNARTHLINFVSQVCSHKCATWHNELRYDLADLAVHNEATANRFYYLMEKEEACLQAASDLHRIMRFSKQKEMENQHEAAGTKSDDGASYSPKNSKELHFLDL